MKVAIWGSYNYGNFGDDLMAIIIGKYLIEKNCEVYVYKMAEDVALSYDFVTIHCIDELISKTDICFVGGGALLSIPESNLGRINEEYLEEVLKLNYAINNYKCPLYFISVGGDGSNSTKSLNCGVAQLMSSPYFKGGTLRLFSEVNLVSEFNKDVFCYGDIVWLTSLFFDIRKQKKKHIGVNLGNSKLEKLLLVLIKLISSIYGYKVHTISLHRENYNLNYELESQNLIKYEKIEEFLSSISICRLIISNKLHLGLTSLSFKSIFISLNGHKKTVSALSDLSLDKNMFFVQKNFTDIYFFIFNLLKVFNNDKKYILSNDRIRIQIDLAKKHLKFIDDKLETFSKSEL